MTDRNRLQPPHQIQTEVNLKTINIFPLLRLTQMDNLYLHHYFSLTRLHSQCIIIEIGEPVHIHFFQSNSSLCFYFYILFIFPRKATIFVPKVIFDDDDDEIDYVSQCLMYLLLLLSLSSIVFNDRWNSTCDKCCVWKDDDEQFNEGVSFKLSNFLIDV